jgi:G3E family GTPase
MKRPDSPTPVTLVLGASTSAKSALVRRLHDLQDADSPWAWLLQDLEPRASAALSLTAKTSPPTRQRDGAYLRLSSGCVCCLGQAELQAQLPKLLRAGPWARIVIELASVSHPAKVIDFLRSKTWRMKLDIEQVLLAIDNEQSNALQTLSAATPAQIPAQSLARAQLLASTQLVSVDLSEAALAAMRESLSKIELCADLNWVDVDAVTINQVTTAHTSCDLGTSAANTHEFELRWSALRLFDRKRVLAVLNEFAQSHSLRNAIAIFATERAWYEWRVIDSHSAWCESEYRVCNLLRIKNIDVAACQTQLRDLQFAIEDTITN